MSRGRPAGEASRFGEGTAQAIEGINSALPSNLTGVDTGVRRFGRWKDYWAATTN